MYLNPSKIHLNKIFALTLTRQIISFVIFIPLIILRNDLDDIVTFLCCFVKILILFANCGLLIKKNKSKCHLLGLWIISCVMDSCFSMQMLISIIFHSEDFHEDNSILLYNFYLMVYIIFDTIMNMFLVLLIVIAIKNAIQDDYLENELPKTAMLPLHNRKNISKTAKVINYWQYEILGLKDMETGRS